MTKQYHDLIQYAFEQTLLMMYRHFFQYPNTGVIRKLIPSQPLRAKEVGVFCSEQSKPLIKTWGRVVSQLIQKKTRIEVADSPFLIQRTTSKKKAFLWNQKTRVVPYHIDSQSLKREKPTEPEPIKEA